MTAALREASLLRGFALWQPAYEAVGIPIFPVDADKRPLVKNWQKATLHSSRIFAGRFGSREAFGFCPRRAGITVLDIDTTDEAVAADLFARYGEPKALVRTASGKLHGFYRHNGEDRLIRPEGPLIPYDILGDGFSVAPFSVTLKGTYQFIRGDLETLRTLDPLIAAPRAPALPRAANEASRLRDGDGRNHDLFRFAGAQARHCDDQEQLLDVARHYAAEHFHDTMPDLEIARTVASVWRYKLDGRLFVGKATGEGRKVILDAGRIGDLAERAGAEAVGLYAVLKKRHPGNEPFPFANAAAGDADVSSSRRGIQATRKALLDLGIIERVRGASSAHGCALFRWRDQD